MKRFLPEPSVAVPVAVVVIALVWSVVLFWAESSEQKKDAGRFSICPLCGEKEPVPEKVTYIF
jgi:nitrogen fixation-related uncharacterized protein